jgi:hypothetical protein
MPVVIEQAGLEQGWPTGLAGQLYHQLVVSATHLNRYKIVNIRFSSGFIEIINMTLVYIRCKSLLRRYINTNTSIMFLDIIHHPFYI